MVAIFGWKRIETLIDNAYNLWDVPCLTTDLTSSAELGVVFWGWDPGVKGIYLLGHPCIWSLNLGRAKPPPLYVAATIPTLFQRYMIQKWVNPIGFYRCIRCMSIYVCVPYERLMELSTYQNDCRMWSRSSLMQ